MREFDDRSGRKWIASAKALPGPDFKGRYVFVARPRDGGPDGEVLLDDVRWNSEKTARRTLRTMSPAELRRRLRYAAHRTAQGMPPAVG